MKWKCIYIIFLSFLVLKSELQGQDVNSMLKKVKAKLELVKDYQADGVMKLNVSFLQVPDSKVVIYYKKPDKFRIRQQKGISLVPRGGISINLNSILNGSKYTAVDAGTAVLGSERVNLIKLLPFDEEGEVVLSTLYIDPKSYLVKKVTTTTKENGSYAIQFVYGAYSNWGLPDELVFSFNTKDYKLPKGMTFDYEEETRPDTTKIKNSRGEIKISFTNYSINKGIRDEVFEEK